MDLTGLSFNDIARQFPDERIIVDPLKWSPRHLSLMSCRFLDTTLSVQIPDSQPSRRWPGPDKNAELTAANIARGTLASIRTARMASLLEYHSFERDQDDLTFYYGKMQFNLSCSTWMSPPRRSKNQQSFPVAFLDFDLSIKSPRVFQWSYEDYVLATSYSHPYFDPCIAGFVIAMAQKARRKAEKRGTLNPNAAYTAHVMLSDKDDKPHIHIYSARIANAFLDKFADPSQRPQVPDAARLDIQHHTIPYNPYATFHSRLVGTLCRFPQARKQVTPENRLDAPVA